MGQDPGTGSTAVSAGAAEPTTAAAGDPEQIRRDIEQTRAQLGDTVEALAHKADVKAQATRKLDQAKTQATQKLEQTKASVAENPTPFVAAGALVAGLLAWRLIRA
jgi:methyl-accepting chemotaxis protein